MNIAKGNTLVIESGILMIFPAKKGGGSPTFSERGYPPPPHGGDALVKGTAVEESTGGGFVFCEVVRV